jgi:hypothetical protein
MFSHQPVYPIFQNYFTAQMIFVFCNACGYGGFAQTAVTSLTIEYIFF